MRGYFDEAIFAPKGVFAGDVADEVGDDRLLIEEIAKKIIDFDVQLLATLHCFSEAFSDLISMLDMMKKNNICANDVSSKAIAEIKENNCCEYAML